MTYESFVARWRKWNWEAKRISKISLQPFVNMFVIHFPRTRTIARKQCQPKKRKKGTHKKKERGSPFPRNKKPDRKCATGIFPAQPLEADRCQPATAGSLSADLPSEKGGRGCLCVRCPGLWDSHGELSIANSKPLSLILSRLLWKVRHLFSFSSCVWFVFFFSSFCFVLILIFISTIVSDIFLETNYLSSPSAKKFLQRPILVLGMCCLMFVFSRLL